jgi:hypothetical protein
MASARTTASAASLFVVEDTTTAPDGASTLASPGDMAPRSGLCGESDFVEVGFGDRWLKQLDRITRGIIG